MIQIHGDVPVDTIGREDARRFQRVLQTLPANWGSSKKYVKKPMSPQTAAPYSHRRDDVRAKDKKVPFSVEDLQRIFEPVHDLPSHHWIPLISLFTGMRMGEICQLERDDFAIRDGIEVILARDDDGRQLKTASARRIMPIHPELKRLGLLRYAKTCPGGSRLFPELRKSAAGYYSDLYSRWFSDFLRQRVGVIDHRKSFHSFRHGAKQALADAGVAPDRIDELLGWGGGKGMQSIYGGHLKVSVLAEAVSKIKYEGLSLDHLKK